MPSRNGRQDVGDEKNLFLIPEEVYQRNFLYCSLQKLAQIRYLQQNIVFHLINILSFLVTQLYSFRSALRRVVQLADHIYIPRFDIHIISLYFPLSFWEHPFHFPSLKIQARLSSSSRSHYSQMRLEQIRDQNRTSQSEEVLSGSKDIFPTLLNMQQIPLFHTLFQLEDTRHVFC